jgi:nicotinate-nucleotide pyrophosphorylase (carboxylating)
MIGEADALTVGQLIGASLAEDLGDGDRTSEWTISPDARGEARVIAREPGIVYGLELAGRVFEAVDPELSVTAMIEDGTEVTVGEAVLEVRGTLRAILAGERTALNFVGWLSGIATLTARYVAAVENTGCRIADTRKTTPCWRALEKRATAAGGALNHRAGLYDMVLIKENHVRAAGGLRLALDAARDPARSAGMEVEVEVTSLAELEEALAGKPERILLDNMTIDELTEAVLLARSASGPTPLLEASGGVTLESVRSVAQTGVDYISVGAITHSAPALDLSLLVTDA